MRVVLLTCLAMIAFAANSVLARLALIETEIGAGSFVLLRLISGTLMLNLLILRKREFWRGSWVGGASLLAYAGFFSYAYISLGAGMGAVILFASVQFTMLGWGFRQGERLNLVQGSGLIASALCLVWLVAPGHAAPSLIGAALMLTAGLGWGVYSLLGQGSQAPLADTAGNFTRASVLGGLILIHVLFLMPESAPSPHGIGLAILSGAVTSGLGYALWYRVVKEITTVTAGVAQLTVPAFAALGGILVLSEPISLRFVLASLGILGGVALTVLTPYQLYLKVKK